MFGKIKYVLKKNLNMKTSYVVGITVFSLFLVVGGISVALYTSQKESRGSLNIVTGNLISILESDSFFEGKKVSIPANTEKEITITINNIDNINIKYQLYYQPVDGVKVGYLTTGDLPPEEMGELLTRDSKKTFHIKLKNTNGEEKQIEFGSQVGFSNKNLEFPLLGKKILDSYYYHEDILNGADPILGEKMIPVIISGSGEVTYINPEIDEWYKYKEQRWANAVILVDQPSNSNYKMGNTILEKDIESYFVWIPRYKYQIFNTGNYESADTVESIPPSIAHEIQIGFQHKSDPKEQGNEIGEYLTHPAFTLGEKEMNGIWVGKFETGYNQNNDTTKSIETTEDWTTAGAQQNEVNSDKIIVKPNVYSWRYINMYGMFMNAYNYQRNLDSHTMKNIEWGAVAYLSHSRYGIQKKVNINNNSSYLTGYSAVEGTDQSDYPGDSGIGTDKTLPYNTPTGYLATTTGNISGIYDMSGGVHECMAAYKKETNYLGGFEKEELENKYQIYFDVYSSDGNGTTYKNRILGDATGEMGPFYYYQDGDGFKRYHSAWYSESASFLSTWFDRGGFYKSGILASQFYFAWDNAIARDDIGSRLVLAP